MLFDLSSESIGFNSCTKRSEVLTPLTPLTPLKNSSTLPPKKHATYLTDYIRPYRCRVDGAELAFSRAVGFTYFIR